ncbi:MAG: MarR family winged helix-turn-helix transcriptional regulator [Acidimicrobiales bacterium]
MNGGPAETGDAGDQLHRRMVAFVRAFGLHRPDETPCGAPVPVSEAHAVTVLDEHGALTQSQLALHLGLTKSTVSRLVDQLERRGWAQRQVGDGDARQRLIALTNEGAKASREIGTLRRDRLRRLFDQIPEHERPAVLAALDALVAAARQDPS